MHDPYIVKPLQEVKFIFYMFESARGPFNLITKSPGKMAASLILSS